MSLAITFDEAKAKLVRIEGDGTGTKGGLNQTKFFGSSDKPDLPEANLSYRDPGRVAYPHYHLRDQFQVTVRGKGKLGRRDLTPYCVHFARACTPYGPLASDPHIQFIAFVLRPHYDPGSQYLPESAGKLKQMPDRQPWQIMRQAIFPILEADTPDSILQAIPDIKDEQGLAAYTLSMKPNTKTYAPDPSLGDGQYLLVIKGSLLHDTKQYPMWGLIFVGPGEGPFPVHAGPEGLEALILNFPRPRTQVPATSASAHTTTRINTWQCTLCAFVYDEAKGLPDEDIASGTCWQDIPESWSCPDCGASKADFRPNP